VCQIDCFLPRNFHFFMAQKTAIDLPHPDINLLG
jgi:hypothetical protein